MKKNSNIRDIAKKAGVSVASVSRALQNPPSNKVSPKLREKILSICDEMRYYPNMHTVRMFSKRSNTIALFVPPECMHVNFPSGTIDFNLAAAIGGVEYQLAKHSVYLTIASVTDEFLSKKEYLKFCRSKMVDGIIIWGWTEQDSYLHELAEEDIPLVMIQSCNPGVPLIHVNGHDYEGMRQIVEYIAKMGHKDIAYISPLETSLAGQNRTSGFLDTAKHLKLNYSISTAVGFAFEDGVRAANDILNNESRPTCIVAANDLVALGCIDAAKKMGINVPSELSVTGADGLNFPGSQPLTTYISPSFEIGSEGASLMMQAIDSKEYKPCKKDIPINFIEGSTVAIQNR